MRPKHIELFNAPRHTVQVISAALIDKHTRISAIQMLLEEKWKNAPLWTKNRFSNFSFFS